MYVTGLEHLVVFQASIYIKLSGYPRITWAYMVVGHYIEALLSWVKFVFCKFGLSWVNNNIEPIYYYGNFYSMGKNLSFDIIICNARVGWVSWETILSSKNLCLYNIMGIIVICIINRCISWSIGLIITFYMIVQDLYPNIRCIWGFTHSLMSVLIAAKLY